MIGDKKINITHGTRDVLEVAALYFFVKFPVQPSQSYISSSSSSS